MNTKEDATEYIISLGKGLGYRRSGKTFSSCCKKYFYDVGTGKVLECEENAYKILKQLTENGVDDLQLNLGEIEFVEAIKLIKESVENENILQANPVTSFVGNQVDQLEEMLEHNMQYLCLELTQQCNLRCSYCIYQSDHTKFRDFNANEMDFGMAKKAIDCVLSHSEQKDLHFGFYGGEPMLKYDLIQKCVSYIRSSAKDKELWFTMTTNGTLMNEERAKYFASIPNFVLVFSLDGYEEIHNEMRRFPSGEGSFKSAITGFNCALKAYGDRAYSQIMINSVVSPPYSDNKFDLMQQFFTNKAKGIQVTYSYVDEGDKKLDKKDRREISSPISEWLRRQENDKTELFAWGAITNAFLNIHKRPLCEKPITSYRFNGCCVPGSRRLYVNAMGKYLVCERVGNAPDIGNVDEGLDIEKIREIYVEEYMEKSINDCKNCWLVNMCSVCYSNCYNHKGFSIVDKREMCENQRYITEQMLGYYHEILESKPDVLKYLNEIEVK